jgi:hypothetical protein
MSMSKFDQHTDAQTKAIFREIVERTMDCLDRSNNKDYVRATKFFVDELKSSRDQFLAEIPDWEMFPVVMMCSFGDPAKFKDAMEGFDMI